MEFQCLNPNEAKEIILNDEKENFFSKLSRFDFFARLGIPDKRLNPIPTKEQLQTHITNSLLPWRNTKPVECIVQNCLRSIHENYEHIYLPKINLILTNGFEESNAPYTRNSSIIFPRTLVQQSSNAYLNRVIIHELFHIISKYNTEIKKATYKSIGFNEITEPRLPYKLQPYLITNPDVCENNWGIEVLVRGEKEIVVPIIFSDRNYSQGKIFDYINFRLLNIKSDHEKIIMYKKEDVQGLYNKIGRNTNYIIHPEEILADNFVILLDWKKECLRENIESKYNKTILERIDTAMHTRN